MNTLLPIIRRERRPLLPPDEPVAVVVPVVVAADEPLTSPAATAVEPPRQPKHETKTKKS